MELGPKDIGEAGLQGWRASLADRAAAPIAARSPLAEDQVRALVGATFLVLSVLYVVNAVRALTGDE